MALVHIHENFISGFLGCMLHNFFFLDLNFAIFRPFWLSMAHFSIQWLRRMSQIEWDIQQCSLSICICTAKKEMPKSRTKWCIAFFPTTLRFQIFFPLSWVQKLWLKEENNNFDTKSICLSSNEKWCSWNLIIQNYFESVWNLVMLC